MIYYTVLIGLLYLAASSAVLAVLFVGKQKDWEQ